MQHSVKPVEETWAASALYAAALYISAVIVGLALLVGLFKSGLLGSIDILFYRGVVFCGIAAGLTIAVIVAVMHRAGLGRPRDALAAGMFSLGVNLTFLVIAPVTVDRSLSVFIVGYLAAHPGQSFSGAEIEAAFRSVYIGQYQQIERRMREQVVSGNVAEKDGAYWLTAQGEAFLRMARWTAWLFDTDRRLVDQVARPIALAPVQR
jgi:hypothetical protein